MTKLPDMDWLDSQVACMAPAATPVLRPSRRQHTAISLMGALLLAGMATCWSQTARPASPSSAAQKPVAVTVPAKPAVSKPVWAELTVQQQLALRPLALGWDTINETQKRKWIEISRNYPALSLEGQVTMHSRMTEWAGLSPQQRAAARLNFARTKELSKELTPDEKKAKWESYQALSPEEKQKLAATASPKPTGAATAVKPVAPQKLVSIAPASAPRAKVLQPVQTGDSSVFNEAPVAPTTSAPKP